LEWTGERVEAFLREVARWASGRNDILAVALVGSWARGTAHAGSDVDLMLLALNPTWFRRNDGWLAEIDWCRVGSTAHIWRDADYGVVWSRHLLLNDGTEIEFGFGAPSWAAVNPVDPGTRQVVAGGCRPVHDPEGLIRELVHRVQGRP
jgi:hypothetical protein